MAQKPQFGRIFRRKWKKPDGTVVELPTWWIEYYHGRQIRESSQSDKYRDAELLLKTRNSEMHTGTLGGPTARRIKVAELLDDLKLDFEVNGKSVAWLGFVYVHLRPFFGEMRAASVGTTAVQQYIAKRREDGVSNGTINRELGRLRRAFNLGNQASPPKVTRVPRIPTLEEKNVRKGFFEHDQFVALRAELPEPLRPVITFAYYTGCRRGEILALRWNQVDLKQRVIRLEPGETKNEEARTIPLMGELQEMLTIQKQTRDQKWPTCDWVFFRYGRKIKDFRGAWDEACKRCGEVFTGRPANLFHDLRRTGVRNMIRAGVPERVAMAISGHKTRAILDRYNIVSERDLHEAALRVDLYVEAQAQADKDKLRTSAESQENGPVKPTRNLLI